LKNAIPKQLSITVSFLQKSLSKIAIKIAIKNSYQKSLSKIAITSNDRNHSAFHLGMAVLGFEIRLPCHNF
jgi:hypothetical protein